MLCKKAVLRNFAKFTGKHMCQSLVFNKVAGLRLYQKRDSGTGVFLWILRNSSRTSLGGCFSEEKHSLWYWDSHKKYQKTSTCLWIVLPKAINFEIRNSLLSTSYTWYVNVHNHLCWKHETNSANIYLFKVTIETSEKGAKYVQS